MMVTQAFMEQFKNIMTTLDKEGIEYFRIPGVSCLLEGAAAPKPRINPTKHLPNSHHHTTGRQNTCSRS